MTEPRRAGEGEETIKIVNAVFSCVEGVGCTQIIFHSVRARELVAAALAAQAAQTRALREALENLLDSLRGFYIEARIYGCTGFAGNHREDGCVRFVIDRRGRDLPEGVSSYENHEANAFVEALLARLRAALTGAPRDSHA